MKVREPGLGPDPFVLFLIATVALATILPCRDEAATIVGWAAKASIALLFFLHGAKLSREALLKGIGPWRLHLTVLAGTFVLFPALGLLIRAWGEGRLTPGLADGVLFLCLLPSTVQSSIAFTSIAKGNVPAAVCSATLSNLVGIFATPILVAIFIAGPSQAAGPIDLRSIDAIARQLLAPFILGHLSRPLTSTFLERRKAVVSRVDRASILLVVYGAFSAAVVQGLWRKLSAADIALVAAIDGMLLATALVVTRATSRLLGCSRKDEIAIVFCGSKKSLASGVPMASALFPGAAAGLLILPLMIFHQIQLMVCAVLARRYAAIATNEAAATAPVRS